MFGLMFISRIFIFGSVWKMKNAFIAKKNYVRVLSLCYITENFLLTNTNYFMTAVANYDSWWHIKKATQFLSYIHII